MALALELERANTVTQVQALAVGQAMVILLGQAPVPALGQAPTTRAPTRRRDQAPLVSSPASVAVKS